MAKKAPNNLKQKGSGRSASFLLLRLACVPAVCRCFERRFGGFQPAKLFISDAMCYDGAIKEATDVLDLRLYGWAVALGVVCAICSGVKFLIHCAIRPDEEGVHATVVDIWNDVNIESICFRYDTGEVARLPARKSVRRSLHVGQTGTLRVYKNRWFRDFTPDP